MADILVERELRWSVYIENHEILMFEVTRNNLVQFLHFMVEKTEA